jgi:hypothetical protein
MRLNVITSLCPVALAIRCRVLVEGMLLPFSSRSLASSASLPYFLDSQPPCTSPLLKYLLSSVDIMCVYLQSYSVIDRLREKRFSHERGGHLLDAERDAQPA